MSPQGLLCDPDIIASVIEVCGALVVVLDPEGRIMLFNRACEQATGYTFEEVEGTHVWDRFLVPEGLGPVKAVFEELTAGHFPNEYENFWVAKDGTPRCIHWKNTAMLGRDGAVRYVIATGLDITERKRAEDASRQLASLVESSDDAIFGVGLDGTILSWNRSATRIFGHTAQAAIGRKISLVLPHGIDDNTAEALERIERGERAEYIDVPRVRGDGRIIHVALTISPIRDESGRVVGTARTAHDITARKKTEAALRESAAQLRKLSAAVEQSPSTVIITDTGGRIEYVNPKFTRLTGYTLEEVRGENPRILKSGETGPEEYEDLWKTITAGHAWHGVFHNRKKNGELYWEAAYVGPIRDPEGKITNFLAVQEDITEYRRLQERFRSIFESAPNGMVMTDEHGRIMLTNRQMEVLFGYDRRELIGQSIELLVPARLRERHRQHRQGFMQETQPRMMGVGRELFARRRDGSEFPVEIGLSPVDTAEGRLVIAAVADITSRRQAELEAKRRLEELAHVSRVSSISQVASGLAHEVNQPLTAIVSYAEACRLMLESSNARPDVLLSSLGEISKQGERAGEIITRLREFVRKGEGKRRVVAINTLVQGVLDLLRHEIGANQIRLHLELGERLPPVEVDPVQIEQVLFNLIRNAIEAMASAARAEGELIITTAPAHADSQAVEVTVQDTGDGLSGEVAKRLFDPFYTTKSDGLGLGLSISRSIVQAHGGRIWASSDTDPGSAFHFTLPAVDAPVS